jgi:hypothetical protein
MTRLGYTSILHLNLAEEVGLEPTHQLALALGFRNRRR